MRIFLWYLKRKKKTNKAGLVSACTVYKRFVSFKDWYNWSDDQVLNWLRKIGISSEGFVNWDNKIRLDGEDLKKYYRDLVENYHFSI